MRLAPALPLEDDAEFVGSSERLWLTRRIGNTGPVGMFIGLNPSVAGATNNDPTIRKGIGFASRWGWSGFIMVNLFTHIETHSEELRSMALDAVHADRVLEETLLLVEEVVLCWGTGVPKPLSGRPRVVMEKVRLFKRAEAAVWTLGLATNGAPMHPLMLGYATERQSFVLPVPRSRRDD